MTACSPAPMLRCAHRLILLLTAFALIGATMVQPESAQGAVPVAMAGMPCDMMMSMADAGHGGPMAPCKGMTPDCIKQMGCVADVGLPARVAGLESAVRFSMVDYWSAWSAMTGLDQTPDPMPPRTT
jgi:hypothetical protein